MLGRLLLSLLFKVLLPLCLTLLLKGQVQFEREHLWVLLVEMLTTSDFAVLKLVKDDESFAV